MMLALFVSALGAQTPVEAPKGSIAGTVRDSLGAPLSGVTVQAAPGAEPITLQVGEHAFRVVTGVTSSVTDARGKYTLSDLAAGIYYLRSERDAGSAGSRPVSLEQGQNATVDFVIPVPPTLAGHVLDVDGKPVAGAAVYALTEEYRLGLRKPVLVGPQVTREDGAFRFDSNLEAKRTYYVFVDREVPKDLRDRAEIEAPTYYPSATRLDAALAVELQPGEQREKVDIQIAHTPFACVSGTVHGIKDVHAYGPKDSSPLAIFPAGFIGTNISRRVKMDEQEAYRFCGLAPGDYVLAMWNSFRDFSIGGADISHVDLEISPSILRVESDWAEGSAPHAGPVSDDVLSQVQKQLGLPAGADDTGLRDLLNSLARGDKLPDDQLDRLAARTGQLREAIADGLQFTRHLYAPSPLLAGLELIGVKSLNSVTTNSSVPSNHSMPPFPPGEYITDFHVFGDTAIYPKEMTFDGVRISDGMVRVEPGSESTLRMTLARDVAKIAVTVTDSDSRPLPFATVILVPASATTASEISRLAVHGFTDQNGTYRSPPLVPGTYRVLASTQTVRWNVVDDLERLSPALFQGVKVEAPSRGAVQVTITPVVIF